MTVIVGGVTKAGPARPAAQSAQAGSGFTLHPEALRSAAPLAASEALADLGGVLALQEIEADIARDRRARRHGTALLDALTGVQLALLDAGGGQDALTRLQALAEQASDAADPRLAEIVAAIRLRARVELARRAPPPR